MKIDIHNVAVSNSTGIVGFQSGIQIWAIILKICKRKSFITDCDGCNGAIADLGDRNKVTNYSISSVRLYPYLESHYSESFIDNICMIKTDTEGHDAVILSDLDERLRPPIIWTEWYRHYKFITYDIENETFLMEVYTIIARIFKKFSLNFRMRITAPENLLNCLRQLTKLDMKYLSQNGH